MYKANLVSEIRSEIICISRRLNSSLENSEAITYIQTGAAKLKGLIKGEYHTVRGC